MARIEVLEEWFFSQPVGVSGVIAPLMFGKLVVGFIFGLW